MIQIEKGIYYKLLNKEQKIIAVYDQKNQRLRVTKDGDILELRKVNGNLNKVREIVKQLKKNCK